MEKLIPDTTVLVDGVVVDRIKSGLEVEEIIVHEAVVAFLEHQTHENKAVGFLGLDQLKELRRLSEEGGFVLRFGGVKPRHRELQEAHVHDIAGYVTDLAYDEGGMLLTADKVQYKVALAKRIEAEFVEVEKAARRIKVEEFFDEKTMSVHLRENVFPYAKKGMPGGWSFDKVRDTELSRDEIQDISGEIIEEAGIRKDGFIEIERPGSTIVQLANYRIVITKPPFSDGWEITAVRPVAYLTLEDYGLSEKLADRIKEQAEGILIAGSPGMGKSTFAQALAAFYASQNRIVKTVEAPRDLVLKDNVTQYAISHGDAQEIHDILLLSRPDNTVFDEMRNTEDFKLYADLRLAGIGLAGVVHATNPIDAIQRFVGRIELGVIPQIVDTVIFIKDGAVGKVLSLQMVVKVPAGMVEADLARPVVVVTDFDTLKPEFELYSYGEETVVVPVKGSSGKSPSQKLATGAIRDAFSKYGDVEVDVVSDNRAVVRVPKEKVSGVIGKQGANINAIEKELGIGIDVQELESEVTGDVMPYSVKINRKGMVFELGAKYKNKDVDIYVNKEYLLSAKIGKGGVLKVVKNNKIGRVLLEAVNSGEKVEIRG